MVGTPTAYRALLEQLPQEQSVVVKGWIARFLSRPGMDDEYLAAVIKEYDRERTLLGRRTLAWHLATSGNPAVIPKFIELLNYGRDWDVRRRAAWALGELQAKEAVEPLVARLQVEDILVDQSPSPEDSYLVSREIIRALLAINDGQAVPGLLKILQDNDRPPQLYIRVVAK